MGLFQRRKPSNDDSDNNEPKKEKGGWRRPANTAFKQQRLKAWQPILTPKTVLPTLFIIGVIFGPIGGLLVWGSSTISEVTFDYTDCDTLSASTTTPPTFTPLPSNKYTYRLRSADSGAPVNPPKYAFIDNSANTSLDASTQRQCVIQFDIPAKFAKPVFLYYKLTNFYQNHRRYVKSLNSDQLRGRGISASELNGGDCKPLGSIDGKAIYPCGLIANSLFNDTYSNLTQIDTTSNTAGATFVFADNDIAWPGEKDKYVTDPTKSSGGYTGYDQIVPPPNWALRYPNNYTEAHPPPDLRNDQHFQNWMRTAGLPTFTKLYGKSNDDLQAGTYEITVNLNYPVRSYRGTKSIVITTVSWIGGKNPFLGWAYVAASGVFILLAIAGTARHLIKPRRLGDMSLLSWNR